MFYKQWCKQLNSKLRKQHWANGTNESTKEAQDIMFHWRMRLLTKLLHPNELIINLRFNCNHYFSCATDSRLSDFFN